jgi:hypothetical protein
MEILCRVTRLLLYQLTEILKMNSDLMHATGERFTEHDTRFAVVAELLECRRTIFAFWRHLAHTDFVAYDLDGLLALVNAAGNEKNLS